MAEGVPTLVARHAREQATEPSRLFFLRALRRDQRGTALVEFAIVAIPLFLVVIGILDFGRALQYYNDLTQVAGAGARAAAVNQDPNGGAADNNFQHQLACETTPGELRTHVNVKVSQTPVNPGDPVQVTASYTFNFIPFLGKFAGLTTLTLNAIQTERYEFSGTPTFSSGNDITGGVTTCP